MRWFSYRELVSIGRAYSRGRDTLDRTIGTFFRKRHKGDFLVVDSGTSALQALIDDFQLQGSEIIIPSFICSDVFFSVFASNTITPRLVDSEKDSLTISVKAVASLITPQTKAVIIVHTLGIPNYPEAFRKLCTEKKILLLEDCAHCIDVPYKQKHLGSYGDAAFFSFTKEMPTFAGGVYLNNQRKIRDEVRKSKKSPLFSRKSIQLLVRSLFSLRAPTPQRKDLLYQKQIPYTPIVREMPKLAKAIFSVYSSRLDVARNRTIAQLLFRTLKKNHVSVPITPAQIASFSGKSLPLLTSHQASLVSLLSREGIEPGIGWTPCFSQNSAAQEKWKLSRTPVAERYSRELVALPLRKITAENKERIVQVIIDSEK